MKSYDWDIVVVFIVLFLCLALAFGLLFADARAFADECIRAGGYVASPRACVR